MNKLFKRGLALLMGLVATTGVFAQMQQIPPMPVDSAVRVGTLPNGLTYYIRHNETPKGQADFYIAQKVGSILEDDNQRGLAHFLEHMCFNGTTNFPGKGIINWLESNGVKFGYNLNAMTGTDNTIYNISSVPVARQSVQDSCLLILHDWACDLTLDPAEIDAERGVIHEEWRRSMAGTMRILEQQLPKMYEDSKYGHRLPIGTMEVVDNFPPQAIIDYYHTWYRPDQQGIIVVGDIDPDYIEGKIKELFSPIQMPENPRERVYEEVEDNDGTIVAIGSDKEMSAPIALMFFKMDNLVPRNMRNTGVFYQMKYLTDVIEIMLNSRLTDIANKPDSPYAKADIGFGNFFMAETKDALTMEVIGKGEITNALDAAYREVLRATRGGFTPGEFERANAEIKSRYQSLYDSRNNTPTDSYSKEYVKAFTEGDPIPGIEVEKQIMDQLTSMMPLEVVNTILPKLISDDNRVVLLLLPEAENFEIPTEDAVLEGLAAVDDEELEPYRDEVRTDPLIPELPAPGTITSEQTLDQWGATEYTLSNGVKVVVKPTTFKDNEIVFDATAKGGTSVLPDTEAADIIFLPYAMSKHGMGAYSNSDLQKYLQGKQVSVNISFDDYTRTVSGSSTKADLPTLMELIYANFTSFNVSEEEFAAAQNMFKGVLANQESTPDYAFGSLVMKTMFSSPSKAQISTAAIDAADHATTNRIVRDMLDTANDFTFYFAGNIDLDVFKPLMLQYIATLPVGQSNVTYEPKASDEPRTGAINAVETMEMTTPQSWVFYGITASEPYTTADRLMTSMLAQVLSRRLLDKVREEMGATYSIGAQGQMERLGNTNVAFQIAFPTKPEMRNEVFAAIDTILTELGQNITDAELNPIKEYMVKNHRAALEENDAWINAMAGADLNGVDVFNGQDEAIAAITVEDLQNYWNNLRSQGNTIFVVLNPAE